jgi:hypothetical protein
LLPRLGPESFFRRGGQMQIGGLLATFTKSIRAKTNAAPISFPMCCHSNGSGMASPTRSATPTDTQRITAAHMTLLSAFTMMLAT